jgi:tellurite resistance protein TerC
MASHELLFWILFNLFVALMLVLDLGVLNRHAHEIKFREALATSLMWIGLAAAFAVGVYFWRGPKVALEFTTGYIVEEALSVDNLFIFLLIFRFFKVPRLYQHKVLFWGIIGALVMRAVFILAGVGLIRRFHWIVYVFGAWLVYTGVRLAFQKETEIHPEQNPVFRAVRRWLPVTPDYVDGKFVVRSDGLYVTPLFLVLVFVEVTDVVFATDSIPAILAITRDPFIVYTSNVFAILGLRSLYFALAGMMELFHYLHYGLSAVLVFIGAKMLTSHYYEMPTVWALAVVAGLLALSIVMSLLFPQKPALPPEDAT